MPLSVYADLSQSETTLYRMQQNNVVDSDKRIEKNDNFLRKNCRFFCGDPNGVRTHVIGVRGQRPRPLDYRAAIKLLCYSSTKKQLLQPFVQNNASQTQWRLLKLLKYAVFFCLFCGVMGPNGFRQTRFCEIPS